MKILFSLFVLSVVCTTSPMAKAQSLRDSTPAEKLALQKVLNALNPITASFDDSNWQTADNNFDASLPVPNGARSHCGVGYTIRLALKNGSPLYHQVMDPLLTYIKSGNVDGDKLESLGDKVEKNSTVTIDIELNGEAIGFGTDAKNNKQLNVSGAEKAFIEAEDNNNPSNNGAYVLAFGNWGNAKHDAENDVLRFRFLHPPQTPYIENVTILMRGNSEKIAEIVSKANWNSLNGTLAK